MSWSALTTNYEAGNFVEAFESLRTGVKQRAIHIARAEYKNGYCLYIDPKGNYKHIGTTRPCPSVTELCETVTRDLHSNRLCQISCAHESGRETKRDLSTMNTQELRRCLTVDVLIKRQYGRSCSIDQLPFRIGHIHRVGPEVTGTLPRRLSCSFQTRNDLELTSLSIQRPKDLISTYGHLWTVLFVLCISALSWTKYELHLTSVQ